LELAVTNKTLALLEKLYQESISTLAPEVMAQEIIDTIRKDLNLEFTGILNFKKDTDTLVPLAFSKSDRLLETLKKLGFLFMDFKIADISHNFLLEKVVYNQNSDMTDNLEEIWGDFIKAEDIQKIKEESHIKTMLLYPLFSGNDVVGVLILGMNREYKTLNTFEKYSIASFTNVIALSLEKAYLYQDLQSANENLRNTIQQRESLVHLVTHKVKGSFTHSKYIFAGILDGTFGETSNEIKRITQHGLDLNYIGIKTVDLVLNAANLQKGTVRYEMKPTGLKELISKIISEKKVHIEAGGLKLEEVLKDGTYNVMADPFWLKEAINNLIENSVKYTKKGQIIIGLEEKEGKALFSVKDTGIGVTEEDKKNLFTEGGRGKDSIKVNVDSTGYGLYSVKLIMDAHKGRVWAESEGENKGSTFFIELPLTQ
jgi:signal transduction histidine kinase